MQTSRSEITLTNFLSAFFRREQETITLITLAAKGDKAKAAFYKTSCARFSKDYDLQNHLIEDNKTKGIYFFVNAGGAKNADIIRYNAFFIENDKLSIEDQHHLLDKSPIQPNIRVVTKNSVHAYWLTEGNCSESEWRDRYSNKINCLFR
jgi:hypothetical protein